MLTAGTTVKIAKEQTDVTKYPYHVIYMKQVYNDATSNTALNRHVEIVCSVLSVL